METLEYGHLLIRRRQRAQALANWLTPDQQRAQAAVVRAMAMAWRSRDRLESEAELDRSLARWVRTGLADTSPMTSHGHAESALAVD
jgi:hypothetical protein